jgi:hypothetical protein
MKNFYPKIINLMLFVSIIVLAFTCYDKSGIEENKDKTQAQALKKILNNSYVKKGAEILDYNPLFEDKSTKKVPAFNKTIEDMYNNNYIRSFIEAE